MASLSLGGQLSSWVILLEEPVFTGYKTEKGIELTILKISAYVY